MSNNFNKVILAGRLTRDPETREAGSSTITHFGLALNRIYYVGEEKREEVCFVEVGFWGKSGETVAKYFKKGKPILVEGHLKFTEWEDKESGQKRNRLAVVGERFEFLGDGGKSEDAAF